jgi:phage terminase small subunit
MENQEPVKLTAEQALAKLKPQQRKFAEAFCATFNASKAAEAAGYSAKTARQQGSRLLTIVDIKNAVKAVLESSAMEPEEIVARWTRLARAGLNDFMRKVEYEDRPKVQQPLTEAIEKIREEIEYEYEFMVRSWDVLCPSEDDKSKELLQHEQWKKHRRIDILRHQMQLERDPKAFRLIDGPPVTKSRMELDLVKADELGMLDLIKIHKENGDGSVSLSLKDGEAAMDNLAKWRGMLTSKVDVTSGGDKISGFQLVDFDGSPLSDVQ